MKKFWYWLPRVLIIGYILFISVFAADAFEQKQWVLALAVHLIPSVILVGLTILAWKNERVGGWLFFISGLGMIVFSHSLYLALPLFIVGILFLVFHKYH